MLTLKSNCLFIYTSSYVSISCQAGADCGTFNDNNTLHLGQRAESPIQIKPAVFNFLDSFEYLFSYFRIEKSELEYTTRLQLV